MLEGGHHRHEEALVFVGVMGKKLFKSDRPSVWAWKELLSRLKEI